jgi:hypothetical protein
MWKFILIGGIVLAGTLFSFTTKSDGDKKKKYHVIHQKNGKMVEYDTVIPMNASYSVEQFLADKGIQSNDVEVIKMPSHGTQMMVRSNGTHEPQMEIKELSEEVEITVEMDDEGNMTAKKHVNGEEVELTEEELQQIRMHHESNGKEIRMEIDEDSKEIEKNEEVKIQVEMDEEGNAQVKKWVNGEEVEVSEEELEEIKFDAEGGQQIRKEIRIEDEISEGDIQEMMQELERKMSEINIDSLVNNLDSLMKHIEIQMESMIEMEEDENGEKRVIIKHVEGGERGHHLPHGEEQMMRVHGGDEDFTLVLVTENYEEENHPAHHEMNIEKRIIQGNHMSISSDSHSGRVSLRFSQDEKMKTLIEIKNSKGKKLVKEKLGDFQGDYSKDFDLKQYGSDTYTITIKRGDNETVQTVTIK